MGSRPYTLHGTPPAPPSAYESSHKVRSRRAGVRFRESPSWGGASQTPSGGPGRQGVLASWMELGGFRARALSNRGLGAASRSIPGTELRVACEDGETACSWGCPAGAERGVSGSRCWGELSFTCWGLQGRTSPYSRAHALLGEGWEVRQAVSGGDTSRESREPGDVPVSRLGGWAEVSSDVETGGSV